MRVLKKFEDGYKLCFEQGSFDEYMVTFYDEKGERTHLIKDADLFRALLAIKDNERTWQLVWDLSIQIDTVTEFDDIQIVTPNETLAEQKLFSWLAAAMIAEERKDFAPLGKRVKLLGIYQVLILGATPEKAANLSKGRSWKGLDTVCRIYGF